MEKINDLKPIIVEILKKNNIKKAGIFGSYARGEAKIDSDIDILIELDKKKDLYDLIGIELELKKKLKKNIDLLTYKSIHPLLKDEILNEEVKII